MKEIKFRGKRKDNGEWVYGDLLNSAIGTLIYFGHDKPIGISKTDAIKIGLDEITVVHSESVGQFTGVYDRSSGKGIYEGDIVKNAQGGYGAVFYEQGRFAFKWSISISVIYNSCLHNDLTIIGNIYDNPELLNQG